MEKSKNEFLELVSTLYILTVLVAVPLYTGGSYWKLGDKKYLLFRNASIVCIGVWLCVIVGSFFVKLLKEVLNDSGATAVRTLMADRENITWSAMDICMLAYGGCVLLSTLCSNYKQTAWFGYMDWYMGAISQLMFVGAYFLISRYYVAKAWVIYLCEAAFTAVIIIGTLNRLGFDPVHLYVGFQTTDWEYSHMLSTIGNINWFCGYCSVMLAFPLTGYLYAKGKCKQIVLYLCSVLGLTLLCIQGSTIGPIIAVVGMGICLLAGLKNAQCFQRGLLLLLGVCLLFPAMGRLISFRNTQAATPVDGDIYAKMLWNIWWLMAFVISIVYILHSKLHGRAQKNVSCTFVILGIISAVSIIGYELWGLSGTEMYTWGSGRGGLWQAALTGFFNGDRKQKLWGAGPDCFAEYIYAMPEASSWIRMEGHWANSIFANAHNEWLNQLVNLGVSGMVVYLSIFLCGFKRYRGMLLGVLALGMYGAGSLVGFQQVLSTPLLFAVLGICEKRCRMAEIAKHLTDEE